MKPYQTIPIQDCGEPLVPLSMQVFAVVAPHPYEALGAPYGATSPYSVRETVSRKLVEAQHDLQRRQPRWRLQIFDAYRPIAVQQFMVNHAYQELLNRRHLQESHLSAADRHRLLTEVYQFWALPSDDPKMPPPHSTGAALDLSLVDETGAEVDMGSPIDELSPRSYPEYFAPNSPLRLPTDSTSAECGDRAHRHRQLLKAVMHDAGFQQHPNEWWHFSYGDQLWAWLSRERSENKGAIARYGRI
jgi:D-alanyl-D-alanine dipeptidase